MKNNISKFVNHMINNNQSSYEQYKGKVAEIQETLSKTCSKEVFDKVNPLIVEKLYTPTEAKHLEVQDQLETLSRLVIHEDHNDNSDLSLSGCISNIFDLFSCGNNINDIM